MGAGPGRRHPQRAAPPDGGRSRRLRERACEARARSIGRGGPAAATGRLRRGDASPGGTDPRERAQEAVESRTTGPDDLASLLDMLDLRRRGD
ncbi:MULTISPECIES: hypothetical protein [unclassified Streptomyces]|uniref:hypothetical protein n=1 Tax=unclassified Streptomyces TaxID=2593676 RepID=UPI002E2F0189|nr:MULTISPECIES: hypothetical protein [unclassified Streptomyces]